MEDTVDKAGSVVANLLVVGDREGSVANLLAGMEAEGPAANLGSLRSLHLDNHFDTRLDNYHVEEQSLSSHHFGKNLDGIGACLHIQSLASGAGLSMKN